MGIYRGPVYNSVSEITGPTGWYNVQTTLGPTLVWVDQDYDGGGWVLALANRRYTSGMNNLTYDNAINTVNYRTDGTDDSTNTTLPVSRQLLGKDLTDVNVFLGLKYWSELAGRESSNNTTVVQFVSATNGTALSATSSHNHRHRWRAAGFNGNYGFTSAVSIANEVGGVSPGMLSHAGSSNPLSTYDNDNDSNGGSCSSYYNNNPWWYSSCWGGNQFAGGGYNDGPYWTSSTSEYSYQYGAIYIK